MIELNRIYNEDVEQLIKLIPDESVDVIPIDPPYLYLKGQKLERPFDERQFFTQCKRILKKDGFVILFGRGTSFYRWNTILADLGFAFKEEIVWDKSYSSSPLLAVSRVHETVAIFTKGKGTIRKVKVPYLEQKWHNLDGIVADIKRLMSGLNNPQSLTAILEYLENNRIETTTRKELSTGISSPIEGSDRAMNILKSMKEGMNEKSIIKEGRDHYATIHPTQKPVRLIERLLQLVIVPHSNPRPVAATFFSGSGAHEEACINLGIDFIGCELDEEYWQAATERVSNHIQKIQSKLFAA